MSILEKEFQGVKFFFHETPDAPILIDEIFLDNYRVFDSKMGFDKGDVILDLGANEGMFSILIAKMFPYTRVIALEPVPRTYFALLRNKGLNGCTNLEAYNVGVGKPGQKTETMIINKSGQSGGSTSFCTFNPVAHEKIEVGLISLDEVFDLYGIERCKLLKIDIEGAEYDVLYPATVLPRVDFMVAEYHTNTRLDFQARRPEALAVWCANHTKLLSAYGCKMAE